MAQKKQKYYTVWKGHKPGVYYSWNDAKKQLNGFNGALYKSFGSEKIAKEAFTGNPQDYIGKNFKKVIDLSIEELQKIGTPIELSLSVDAACNSKTGKFEYQGIWVHNGDKAFGFGPMENGTNNVGEFLALVHALGFLKKLKLDKYPIYTDSKIAMNWVNKKKAKTTSKDLKVQNLIIRAENWLKQNTYKNPILKWETKVWGEIPADFGRK